MNTMMHQPALAGYLGLWVFAFASKATSFFTYRGSLCLVGPIPLVVLVLNREAACSS